ncbi:MAG: hypothetical protein JKY65_14490 [Planctomycetes bacterium]|nr:hypothetical protein [Planctomycetota bacterium]
MKITTLTLAPLLLTSALLAGCGGSGGPGGGATGRSAAPVSTRSLGPLVQDTTALPGLALGQAALSVGDFALVTGGATSLESASQRVTEFELETGQTRPRPDALRVARSGHVMLFTSQGEWLVLGGEDTAGTPLDSIERFDASQGRWILDERVLPIAGRLTSTTTDEHLCLASAGHPFVELLDLESLAWTGSFPLAGEPIEAPALIHLAGRGELVYAHSEFPAFIDIQAGRGAAFSGNLVPQQGASVLPVGDFGVLFIGGRDAKGQPVRRPLYLEVLAPAAIEVGPELPFVQNAAVAWLADGSVLVAGGSWDGRLLDRAIRFDLDGVVERLAPLGEARDQITLLSGAGRVSLIGGRGANGPSALIDVFSFRELAPTQAFAEAARNRQRKLEQLVTIREVRRDQTAADLELSDLISRVETTQAAVDTATEERNRLALELRRAEAIRIKAQATVARLESEARSLEAQIAALDRALRADQLRLIPLEVELERVQRELSLADQERNRQRSRADGLQSQLGQVRGQVASARSNLSSLEAESAKQAAARRQVTVSSQTRYGSVQVAFGAAPSAARTSTTQTGTNYGGVYSWPSILARLNGN